MSKSLNNPIIQNASGKLGDTVVFTTAIKRSGTFWDIIQDRKRFVDLQSGEVSTAIPYTGGEVKG